MKVNVGQLLSASVALARQAGSIIRSVRQSGDLQTQNKGVDDPCTVADVRSQRLIIGGLRSVWPSLVVVGEENTPDVQAVRASTAWSQLFPCDSVEASHRHSTTARD
jgi:3'-phosphoadenosine 5'-phosphosulfate (PAPS) 3'-phosphatase